jgi:Zn-dependent metalloprotease
MRRRASLVMSCLVVSALVVALLPAQTPPVHPGLAVIVPASEAELWYWDAEINRLLDGGELRLRQVSDDTLIEGRQHERLDQYYKGVRVFGGDLSRQLEDGVAISVLGTLYSHIDLDTVPRLTREDATALVEKLTAVALPSSRQPELVVLPMEDGSYRLAWRARVMTTAGMTMYFLDSNTGKITLKYDDLKTVVGTGRGILGDEKKVSARRYGAGYLAWDLLRPAAVITLNMRGDLEKTIDLVNGVYEMSFSDVATDDDNKWTDPVVVDAHVHAGWTQDYLFKRFNRQGLDNANIPIRNLVHAVYRHQIWQHPDEVVRLFFRSAFYCGDGMMLHGAGLPPQ